MLDEITIVNQIDPQEHYIRSIAPIEHEELEECEINIKNIGWTLGNNCPYRCRHCYSMSARKKGMDLSKKIVDRIVSELVKNNIETVNLGGNEPLFTNGPDPKNTLLPYIIKSLVAQGIDVGLTTSGISLIYLERDHPDVVKLLNDVDISFDSPYEQEHNQNRGANLFRLAIRSLEICQLYNVDHSIIMCAMSWNFTQDRIAALVEIAKQYNAHIRINPLKPVEPKHMAVVLTAKQYYAGFSHLMSLCNQVDLGEPLLATVTDYSQAKGCPCGRTSFRIHSITPDGKIPVSPCVYLHDYKVGNLMVDDLYNIIHSPQFKSFRRRNAHPEIISGCEDCELLERCRGGCAARSYLHHAHETGQRSLFVKDPFCPKDIAPKYPFPQKSQLPQDVHLVHRDYLCTWIGKPR